MKQALAPLSAMYGGAVRARRWLYRRGWLSTHRLTVPVISLGNLTTGGSGKSPMTALIARTLLDVGARPAIVSRGYGGSHRGPATLVSSGKGPLVDAAVAGDEPVMLATLLEDVPVIVSRRRVDGGRLAVRLGADCVVLDDGYQHLALHRDLNLLLIDGRRPFGGGRLLPTGALREPADGMSRADAIIITRDDHADPDALDVIRSAAATYCPGAPLMRARARARGLYDPRRRTLLPPDAVRGKRVLCFSGIAHNDGFFDDIDAAGARVVGRLGYPDHHPYSGDDRRRILETARRQDVEAVLTTDKDLARLGGDAGGLPEGLLIWRIEFSLDRPDLLASLLERVRS